VGPGGPVGCGRSAAGAGAAGAAATDLVAAFEYLHTYQESVRIAFQTDLIA
jgi:hypothetical protein